ncbi:hypothetical protein BD779DRAFT_1781441 [Infundibulicybe gibba]|nr:hypothetical protein BD779DRAFT_1781441 [Infundibulicybe gibba]
MIGALSDLKQKSWSSYLQSVPFSTVVPAIALSFVIAYDGASNIRFPGILRRAGRVLSAPFRNFLSLEDLLDPVGDTHSKLKLSICILLGLSFSESCFWLANFSYNFVLGGDVSVVIINAFLGFTTWSYIFLRLIITPPTTTPYASMILAFSHALDPLFRIISTSTQSGWPDRLFLQLIQIAIPLSFVWVGGTFPLKATRPGLNVARPTDVPAATLSCPEDDVTLWSWSTFSFVEPIFDLAKRGTLNDSDIWGLSPFFRHKNIFNKCLQYRARYPTHSLLRFLLVSNSLDLILDVVLELWSAVVGFLPPYAMKEILAVFSNDSPESRREAYYWALVTFIAHLSFAQVDLFQSWHTRRCYERTRGQLFCSLHYKSLKREDISGKVYHADDLKTSADLGKIVNLMQGDSYAVSQRFWEFSGIITSPVRLAIALIFLYQILGWSALSGVVVVLLAYIINYPLARYNIWITRSSWKARDKRMNLVNEFLQNIRFLKFNGWEYYWSRNAHEARGAELQWRVKENIVDTAISFIWTWIPSATALVSFFCYTIIAGERLTVSKAFTSVALFSQLQEPMTALPGQFFAMINAYISMQRIEAFLGEEEVPAWATTLASKQDAQPGPQVNVGFIDATFEWQPSRSMQSSEARFRLGPMNVCFPIGKLTVVTGATGSGKTALLAALLGEMHMTSGHVLISKSNHQVAYCAQNPWLEHATIRDNIVFGSSYGFHEARYMMVLEACALNRDLEIFDAGDMTEIGEKGITLSGGQRARVALARAMYSQANCVLLDDPLAAVDMHTAQQLVQKCLSSELAKDRTIILVTHHTSLCLPLAAYQVELAHGAILRQGEVRTIPEVNTLSLQDVPEPVETYPERIPENEADLLDKTTTPRTKYQGGNGKLIETEARAEGRVSIQTYMTYLRAAGISSWVLTVLLMLLIRMINIANQVFWLSGVKHTHMNTIDGALQNSARNCLSGIFNFVASFTVILVVIPSFAPFALFIAWLYIRLAPPYIKASRDLRRLESVSLSPAFAGFDELLRGIAHVRAFGMENRYQDQFYSKARVNSPRKFPQLILFIASEPATGRSWFINPIIQWLVNGWLRWRYDCLGSVVVFAATMFALWNEVTNGSAAIVIVQAGIFAEASRQLVRVAAQLELDFNSVERVVEYMGVPQEAPAVIANNRPPAYWPSSNGKLIIDGLVVQYAPHLPPALRNLSCTVNPSEKIGIVGRTGSGKSTLALSLLRMVEPTEGQIIIDDIDISTIGLEDLRTRITIISQDVALFAGTIKSNLDPLGEHTHEECLGVLERCHLVPLLNHIPSPEAPSVLDITINQNSLSAGEKQLVALARAILRRTNIIILDEATSQIDTLLDDQTMGKSLNLMHFQNIIILTLVLQTLSLPLHNPWPLGKDIRDLAGLLDGNDPPPNWSTTLTSTTSTTSTSTSISDNLGTTYTPPPTAGVGSTSKATSTPPAEAAEWKVIGIAVISVSFVAAVILATTFFDSWWGFLRDLVLGRPKHEGFEDMTPDWETRSWEIKIANEDGHRYPILSPVNSLPPIHLGKSPDQRNKDLLASYLRPIPNHCSASSVTTPEITYLPENDPHPLDPLMRRPRKSFN